ncbi:hypothetical protein Q4485_08275 [Granulosicoccaceae sp. 1_MG-2023]|nr:hypothetical protein [Granulosicoccaceae sp. 1_MG-2023]
MLPAELMKRPVWLVGMLCVLALIAAGLYHYVLAKPLLQVAALNRSLQSERVQIAGAGPFERLDRQIAQTGERIGKLQRRLSLNSDARDADAIVPYVVGALDSVSYQHGVALKSVIPLSPQKVMRFEEIPFDITIAGDYRAVYQWLQDAEQALQPMTVKHFTIDSAAPRGVTMKLRVVSYRMPEIKG